MHLFNLSLTPPFRDSPFKLQLRNNIECFKFYIIGIPYPTAYANNKLNF